MSPDQFAELGLMKAAAYTVISAALGMTATFIYIVRRMTTRIVDGDGNGGASLKRVQSRVDELHGELRGVREDLNALPCRRGQVCRLDDPEEVEAGR